MDSKIRTFPGYNRKHKFNITEFLHIELISNKRINIFSSHFVEGNMHGKQTQQRIRGSNF